MTDLYNRSLPFAQDRYRQETERRNSMLGAGRTPKKTKCVRCETWRTTETGKVTANGFICHQCGKRHEKA